MSGTSRQSGEKAPLNLYRQAVFPARLVALGWVAGAAAWLPPARLRVRVLAAYDRWKARASRRWWRMQVLGLVVMAGGLVLAVSSFQGGSMAVGTEPLDGSLTVSRPKAVLPLDVGQPSTPTKHFQGFTEALEVPEPSKKPLKLPNIRIKPGNTRSPKKTKKEGS
ncbi:MAG: hypothetical protein K1Y36_30585 [Blastocatellia bacterium]|nr:hypothetical protein [Blastocatellia bacterium]